MKNPVSSRYMVEPQLLGFCQVATTSDQKLLEAVPSDRCSPQKRRLSAFVRRFISVSPHIFDETCRDHKMSAREHGALHVDYKLIFS